MSEDILEDKPKGKWPWLWAIWAFLVIGSFFAIEIPALVNSTGGDTLTEQIEYGGGKIGAWLFLALFIGFIIWLIDHFIGLDSRLWKWREYFKKQKEGDHNG